MTQGCVLALLGAAHAARERERLRVRLRLHAGPPRDAPPAAWPQIQATLARAPSGFPDSPAWDADAELRLLALLSDTAPAHRGLEALLPMRRYPSRGYNARSRVSSLNDAVVVISNPAAAGLPGAPISVKRLKKLLELRAQPVRAATEPMKSNQSKFPPDDFRKSLHEYDRTTQEKTAEDIKTQYEALSEKRSHDKEFGSRRSQEVTRGDRRNQDQARGDTIAQEVVLGNRLSQDEGVDDKITQEEVIGNKLNQDEEVHDQITQEARLSHRRKQDEGEDDQITQKAGLGDRLSQDEAPGEKGLQEEPVYRRKQDDGLYYEVTLAAPNDKRTYDEIFNDTMPNSNIPAGDNGTYENAKDALTVDVIPMYLELKDVDDIDIDDSVFINKL